METDPADAGVLDLDCDEDQNDASGLLISDEDDGDKDIFVLPARAAHLAKPH